MRLKYKKTIHYTSFIIMFLGLAILHFGPEQATIGANTQLPDASSTPPASTPVQTTAAPATLAPTLTPTLTPMPTSTPTPTPTPSLGEQNAALPVRPADDETGQAITALLAQYLTAYYSGDRTTLSALVPEGELLSAEQLAIIADEVTQIDNIACHYKTGLSYADYLVYVCYDIKYAGSNVFLPAIEEYAVSFTSDGTGTVYPSILDDDVAEALLLSRASQSVRELYIKTTILRYMNARLACDEITLNDLVTDSSYINITDIATKTQYIEQYNNPVFIIRECPENITEFRYIVYVSHDVKIINIATLAPGADELMIAIDKENYPKIFFGTISDATSEFCRSSHESDDFIAMYNDVNSRLNEAVANDKNLWEFIQRIHDATGSQNEGTTGE